MNQPLRLTLIILAWLVVMLYPAALTLFIWPHVEALASAHSVRMSQLMGVQVTSVLIGIALFFAAAIVTLTLAARR